MKKLSKLLLIMTISLTPFTAMAATFDDVLLTDDHYFGIEYLVSIGTLQGYDDGTFKPDQTINRAELMKVLVAGQGISPDTSTYQNCFPDVTTDWYAPYVCYAKEQGWVDGYPDNTFKPAQTVNKAEAAKMIVGAYSVATAGSVSLFTDVNDSDWFFDYIVSLTAHGAIDTDTSTYSPADGMNRGLTAETIYRVLVAASNEDDVYTPSYGIDFLTNAGLITLLTGAPYIKTVFYDGEVYQVESDEYVEIGNSGNSSINLEGYTIRGSKGPEYYTFPDVNLAPGESIKVYTNQGDYSFESEDAVWSNSGETVTLYDPTENLVDSYTY